MLNLIFDYDGTLHNTMDIYEPAFKKAYHEMISAGLRSPKNFSREEISRWLGYSAIDMWNSFAPDLKPEQRLYYSNVVGREMYRLIKEGSAHLYDGAKNLLSELRSQGHRLIFLSNCKIAYMETHKEIFHLDDYFHMFYCAENFGWAPKEEIFHTIFADVKKLEGTDDPSSLRFIAIGDRFHDIHLANCHGLPSIGCTYGFGTPEELSSATYLAHSLYELKNIIDTISKRGL